MIAVLLPALSVSWFPLLLIASLICWGLVAWDLKQRRIAVVTAFASAWWLLWPALVANDPCNYGGFFCWW